MQGDPKRRLLPPRPKGHLDRVDPYMNIHIHSYMYIYKHTRRHIYPHTQGSHECACAYTFMRPCAHMRAHIYTSIYMMTLVIEKIM